MPTIRYLHIFESIEVEEKSDISFPSWHIVLVNLWVV